MWFGGFLLSHICAHVAISVAIDAGETGDAVYKLYHDVQQASKEIKDGASLDEYRELAATLGQAVKDTKAHFKQLDQDAIRELERHGKLDLTLEDGPVELLLDDVEVQTEDIPGWLVAGEGGLTVALDIEITPELRAEGLARELVNRIQQQRKDSGLDVTDRIALTLDGPQELQDSVASNLDYIRTETLAEKVEWAPVGPAANEEELEPNMTVAIAMVAIQ